MTIENYKQIEFSYDGIKYHSVVTDDFDYWNITDKCNHCDLKVNGRKLCYNNNCNCGSCGGIVFKRAEPKLLGTKTSESNKKATSDVDQEIKIIELETLVEALKNERKMLIEQNKGLQMHLQAVINNFNENKLRYETLKVKYDEIYIRINKAIKGVFYNN